MSRGIRHGVGAVLFKTDARLTARKTFRSSLLNLLDGRVVWRGHNNAACAHMATYSYAFAVTISDRIPYSVLTLASGLTDRRSKSRHCTSLTIFSAMEPKTNGRHPEMPCVEITTMSI